VQDLGIEEKPILNLKTPATLAGILLSEWELPHQRTQHLIHIIFNINF
jgi:hypothetical protein